MKPITLAEQIELLAFEVLTDILEVAESIFNRVDAFTGGKRGELHNG